MIEVSAALFIEQNQILLTQRSEKGNLPGYWEFPGGKREENETIFECLEREIKEELNVECKALNIFSENIYKYKHETIKLIAIVAKLLDKNIMLNVHQKYVWIKIKDLLNYRLAPADIYIAKLLLKENNDD